MSRSTLPEFWSAVDAAKDAVRDAEAALRKAAFDAVVRAASTVAITPDGWVRPLCGPHGALWGSVWITCSEKGWFWKVEEELRNHHGGPFDTPVEALFSVGASPLVDIEDFLTEHPWLRARMT